MRDLWEWLVSLKLWSLVLLGAGLIVVLYFLAFAIGVSRSAPVNPAPTATAGPWNSPQPTIYLNFSCVITANGLDGPVKYNLTITNNNDYPVSLASADVAFYNPSGIQVGEDTIYSTSVGADSTYVSSNETDSAMSDMPDSCSELSWNVG